MHCSTCICPVSAKNSFLKHPCTGIYHKAHRIAGIVQKERQEASHDNRSGYINLIVWDLPAFQIICLFFFDRWVVPPALTGGLGSSASVLPCDACIVHIYKSHKSMRCTQNDKSLSWQRAWLQQMLPAETDVMADNATVLCDISISSIKQLLNQKIITSAETYHRRWWWVLHPH